MPLVFWKHFFSTLSQLLQDVSCQSWCHCFYLQLAFQFLEIIWEKPLHLLRLKILIGINKIIIFFQHLPFTQCSSQNYLTNYLSKDLAQTQSQLLCWNNLSPFKKEAGRSDLVFILFYFYYFFSVNNSFGTQSCVSRKPKPASWVCGLCSCTQHHTSTCVWCNSLLWPSENS